jgi:hypothetical protein
MIAFQTFNIYSQSCRCQLHPSGKHIYTPTHHYYTLRHPSLCPIRPGSADSAPGPNRLVLPLFHYRLLFSRYGRRQGRRQTDRISIARLTLLCGGELAELIVAGKRDADSERYAERLAELFGDGDLLFRACGSGASADPPSPGILAGRGIEQLTLAR